MSIYEYLQTTGVLDHGTPAEIEAARKKYKTMRQAEWRRAHRMSVKTISVDFQPAVYNHIKRTALNYRTNPTAFVHKVTLTALNKHPLHFNEVMINQMREALMMNYHRITNLADDGVLREDTVLPIIQSISSLESIVIETLSSPRTIEESLEIVCSANPDSKHYFLHFINSL